MNYGVKSQRTLILINISHTKAAVLLELEYSIENLEYFYYLEYPDEELGRIAQ